LLFRCFQFGLTFKSIKELGGASIGDLNIFTIMDLRQGFNQIVLVAKDRKKTTFHGNKKLWELLVMPFGFKNALVFF